MALLNPIIINIKAAGNIDGYRATKNSITTIETGDYTSKNSKTVTARYNTSKSNSIIVISGHNPNRIYNITAVKGRGKTVINILIISLE